MKGAHLRTYLTLVLLWALVLCLSFLPTVAVAQPQQPTSTTLPPCVVPIIRSKIRALISNCQPGSGSYITIDINGTISNAVIHVNVPSAIIVNFIFSPGSTIADSELYAETEHTVQYTSNMGSYQHRVKVTFKSAAVNHSFGGNSSNCFFLFNRVQTLTPTIPRSGHSVEDTIMFVSSPINVTSAAYSDSPSLLQRIHIVMVDVSFWGGWPVVSADLRQFHMEVRDTLINMAGFVIPVSITVGSRLLFTNVTFATGVLKLGLAGIINSRCDASYPCTIEFRNVTTVGTTIGFAGNYSSGTNFEFINCNLSSTTSNNAIHLSKIVTIGGSSSFRIVGSVIRGCLIDFSQQDVSLRSPFLISISDSVFPSLTGATTLTLNGPLYNGTAIFISGNTITAPAGNVAVIISTSPASIEQIFFPYLSIINNSITTSDAAGPAILVYARTAHTLEFWNNVITKIDFGYDNAPGNPSTGSLIFINNTVVAFVTITRASLTYYVQSFIFACNSVGGTSGIKVSPCFANITVVRCPADASLLFAHQSPRMASVTLPTVESCLDRNIEIQTTTLHPSKTVSLSQTRPSKTVSLSQTRPSKTVSLSETRPSKTVSLSETRPSKTVSLSGANSSEGSSNTFLIGASLSRSSQVSPQTSIEVLATETLNKPDPVPAAFTPTPAAKAVTDAASVVAVISSSVTMTGGPLTSSLALLRIAQCGNSDDDNEDNSLPVLVHPLRFSIPFGCDDDELGEERGAIIGNCVLVPLIAAAIIRWPIAMLVQLASRTADISSAREMIAWPSVAITPLVILTEGISQCIVSLFADGRAGNVAFGVFGAAILIGLIVLWSWCVYRLPLKHLKLCPIESGGIAWWLSARQEWVIPSERIRSPGNAGYTDDDINEGGNGLNGSFQRARVEQQMILFASFLSEKWILWADLASLLLSVGVGVVEGVAVTSREGCLTQAVFGSVLAVAQVAFGLLTLIPIDVVFNITQALLTAVLVVAVLTAVAGHDLALTSLLSGINIAISLLGIAGALLGFLQAHSKALQMRRRSRRILERDGARSQLVDGLQTSFSSPLMLGSFELDTSVKQNSEEMVVRVASKTSGGVAHQNNEENYEISSEKLKAEKSREAQWQQNVLDEAEAAARVEEARRRARRSTEALPPTPILDELL